MLNQRSANRSGNRLRHPPWACRAVLLLALAVAAAPAGELLYNGIRLPDEWPPRRQQLTAEPPETPPYLVQPPDVVPIDVGRQLFVDDFLIQATTLRRTFHQARPYAGNPVVQPDRSWERGRGGGMAMVFSDGVWYDPAAQLYKMWYLGIDATLYATSNDGVHWRKPALDVRPGTNIVHAARRDSATVWLDLADPDPARRYKLAYSNGHRKPVSLYYSADGIHWGSQVTQSLPASDRTTVFWNPFRKVWVVSLRDHVPPVNLRFRAYREAADLRTAVEWKAGEPVAWIGADRLDARRVDLNVRPELYNLDAVAYESLLVGLFSIWRGQPPDRPKPNDVVLGYSRDGFHWDRPCRRPLVTVSERPEAWNWGNVQSAGGGFLVVGDRLFFYISGRTGPRGAETASTGLATLRRDGFASMDAGDLEGVLTTRPVRFRGKHLFVNADVPGGALSVDVLDGAHRLLAESLPLHADNTQQAVLWKGIPDLSAFAGKPVRFRFRLRAGSLYAFWVSPDALGASYGYVAAGGPGFSGPLDTQGSRIYEHCCATGNLH